MHPETRAAPQSSHARTQAGAQVPDPASPRAQHDAGGMGARGLVGDLLHALIDSRSSTAVSTAHGEANGASLSTMPGVDEDGEDGGWPTGHSGGETSGAATGTAAALLTVHDLEETYESWGMRAQMGALVETIMGTTLSEAARGEDGSGGG